jgi:flagellin-like hook-associated protein FlgL
LANDQADADKATQDAQSADDAAHIIDPAWTALVEAQTKAQDTYDKSLAAASSGHNDADANAYASAD